MNNLRVNESMYLSDLVILKCIKERLKELSLDEDFLSMKKYMMNFIKYIVGFSKIQMNMTKLN